MKKKRVVENVIRGEILPMLYGDEKINYYKDPY